MPKGMLFYAIDHVLDRIKHDVIQRIQILKKESKASASNFPLKKGGRA
jgi:hypothetical protein